MSDQEAWQSSRIRQHCEWIWPQISSYVHEFSSRPDILKEATDLTAAIWWLREQEDYDCWPELFCEIRYILSRKITRSRYAETAGSLPSSPDRDFAWKLLHDSVEYDAHWYDAGCVAMTFVDRYRKQNGGGWRPTRKGPPVEFVP